MNAEEAVEKWIAVLRRVNPSVVIDRKTRGAFLGGYRTCMKEADLLRKEIDEQCRLNGMGAQRELKLLTEIEKRDRLLKESHQVILDRLRVQATTIFIDNEEHVEHFFKPLRDFLARLDQEIK